MNYTTVSPTVRRGSPCCTFRVDQSLGADSLGEDSFSQRAFLQRGSSFVPLVVTLVGWVCPLSEGDLGRLAAAPTTVRNVFSLFTPS